MQSKRSIKDLNTLSKWFTTSLGGSITALESAHIAHIIEPLFGYHILQIGNAMGANLLANACIQHKVTLLESAYTEYASQIADLHASVAALPICSDAIDVVVMPHILEFTPHPHQVLREVERILIGNGYLLLTGFNPWSLWGLHKALLGRWRSMPWKGRFFGVRRIIDWLSLLNFEIKHASTFYHLPPISNDKLRNKFTLLEKLPGFSPPCSGGIYLILARKKTLPLTLLKPRWQMPKIGKEDLPLVNLPKDIST